MLLIAKFFLLLLVVFISKTFFEHPITNYYIIQNASYFFHKTL